MSGRWNEFKRSHEDVTGRLKALLSITIYGSFIPSSEMRILRELQKLLIDAGYEDTKLVIDRQSNEDDLDASERCLLYSDANFLIFTHRGMRHGLIDELSFIAQDARMHGRILRCKVFDQIRNRRSAIPRLSMGRVERRRIPRRSFHTIPELKDAIVREAFWHLRDMRTDLTGRL